MCNTPLAELAIQRQASRGLILSLLPLLHVEAL